jgi:lysophospholipase L1-like esterase
MNINDKALERQAAEEVAAVNEDTRETEKEIAIAEAESKAAALREKEKNDSFYQKLKDGFNVRILVLGDTVANGYGASSQEKTWPIVLKRAIEKNYSVEVTLDNNSILDSGAYASYAAVKMIDNKDYDLTIICTGAADTEEALPVYYEALLRAIQKQFTKCSVIAVQEYMETENNARNLSIMTLANAYNAYSADLYNKMIEDPAPYLQEGGYLNDAGHELYASAIYSIIKSAANSRAAYKKTQEKPIYAEAEKYDDFYYVPAARFSRSGNQYSMETSVKGIIAFDFAIPPGENVFDVYVDRVKTATYTVNNRISVPVEHIELVPEEINASRRIGIIFSTEELADNFRGMCVSMTN